MEKDTLNEPADAAREFDLVMRRHNMPVPEDRREGALNVYRELCAMSDFLRRSEFVKGEPGHAFSLKALINSLHETPA
jgi:hypothetical protein